MLAVAALVVALASVVAVSTAPPAAAACGNPLLARTRCLVTRPATGRSAAPGDSTIQGFATSMSVNAGRHRVVQDQDPGVERTTSTSCGSGYYQGNGARKVASNAAAGRAAADPAGVPERRRSRTGLIDCGNWAVSASWAVPSDAVSGVYLAHLVRDDTGGASLIPFVVRNDASHSDIVFQTSDETWQAYNTYGGNSLYTCTVNCPPGSPPAYKGASKVSYNRPFHTADGRPAAAAG